MDADGRSEGGVNEWSTGQAALSELTAKVYAELMPSFAAKSSEVASQVLRRGDAALRGRGSPGHSANMFRSTSVCPDAREASCMNHMKHIPKLQTVTAVRKQQGMPMRDNVDNEARTQRINFPTFQARCPPPCKKRSMHEDRNTKRGRQCAVHVRRSGGRQREWGRGREGGRAQPVATTVARLVVGPKLRSHKGRGVDNLRSRPSLLH